MKSITTIILFFVYISVSAQIGVTYLPKYTEAEKKQLNIQKVPGGVSRNLPKKYYVIPESKMVSLYEPRDKQNRAYIQRYMELAKSEEALHGIPHQITLAQALLESFAGESVLCLKANNHFGMKCHSTKCSPGHCVEHVDAGVKAMFRVYPNAWYSFRAHTLLLNNSQRYNVFKGKSITDWCVGLQGNYAQAEHYAQALEFIITRYIN